MEVYLEITSGEDRGKKLKVTDGARIGRSGCELTINDPKISSVHGRFQKNPRGQMVLEDQESSNGIKINNLRVKKLVLLPGVTFVLGKTHFRVVSASAALGLVSGSRSWLDDLKTSISSLVPQSPNIVDLMPFHQAIQLHFMRGAYTGEKIVLGYGPRTVGFETLDVLVLDKMIPPIAFELIPENTGIKFQTPDPHRVKLNGQSISVDFLNDGDEILAGEALIRVEFL